MVTPIQYPFINGVRHSFASISLKLKNQVYIGFKSVNYGRNRSRTKVWGNHPDPIGKTRGFNDYNCDFELYLAEYNLLQSQLGAGYGDAPFQITVIYSENGFDTIQDVINGATLDTTDASNTQGSDPTVRKVECNPTKILYNGIEDVISPLTGVST